MNIENLILEQEVSCEQPFKPENEFQEVVVGGKTIEKHTLKDGLKNGESIYYKDGRISQRVNYKDGKIDGAVEIYKNGDLTLIMHYKNEQPHGAMYAFENGTLMQIGQYLNGKKNGTFFSFKDGYLGQEENYKNDLLEGNAFIYHPESAQILEFGRYENNVKIGIWKQFNNKGEIIKEDSH